MLQALEQIPRQPPVKAMVKQAAPPQPREATGGADLPPRSPRRRLAEGSNIRFYLKHKLLT